MVTKGVFTDRQLSTEGPLAWSPSASLPVGLDRYRCRKLGRWWVRTGLQV